MAGGNHPINGQYVGTGLEQDAVDHRLVLVGDIGDRHRPASSPYIRFSARRLTRMSIKAKAASLAEVLGPPAAGSYCVWTLITPFL